jgi:hypothetical protein
LIIAVDTTTEGDTTAPTARFYAQKTDLKKRTDKRDSR